jgi:hypothetical protein
MQWIIKEYLMLMYFIGVITYVTAAVILIILSFWFAKLLSSSPGNSSSSINLNFSL